MLMFTLLIGSFLMNSLPTLVFFDSGASKSFVSLSFSRAFDMNLREPKCLFAGFCIANEHEISALSVS